MEAKVIALVTGGASSGKSAFAEELAISLPGPHVYAATMRHGDAETEARIEKHRLARAGKGFTTVELARGSWNADSAGVEIEERGADDAFSPVAGTVLLEDLSNLVVNGCAHLLPRVLASDNVVVVANEIGADGARYDDFTCGFIEQLGSLACGIAARADVVVEVVAGLPNVVKGALP